MSIDVPVDECIDAPAIDACVASAGSVLPDLESFGLLGSADRNAAMMTLERERRRLDALAAALLSDVCHRRTFLDDQHHTEVEWLQAVTNCRRATAKRQARLARMLSKMSAVAAAYATGEIGSDQVERIARLFANSRCRPHLAEAEAYLLDHARIGTAAEFDLVCDRWQAAADPDGAHRDHELSRENRRVSIRRVGAGFELHGEGDALSGEIIADAIAEHARAELENDFAERTARYGDAASEHPLARTAAQRNFDALLAIVLKGSDRREPTDRRPLVVIKCTQHVLEQAIRDYVGANGPMPTTPDRRPDAASFRSWLCETAGGAPVHPRDLVAAALIGQVQRIVHDPAHLTIDLGRRSRLFTGAARDAVLLSGDRCTWPGCEDRGGHIEIDHISSWAAMLGVTSPLNGAPLCPRHNRHKHAGRFTVMRDETGWHHYRPDGSEIAPRYASMARDDDPDSTLDSGTADPE